MGMRTQFGVCSKFQTVTLPNAVWHMQGLAPLAACLAMAHVAVLRLTPNTCGRPSVTSYAYGL